MYVRVEMVLGLLVLLSTVTAAGEPPAGSSPDAQPVGETPVASTPLEGSESAPKEALADTSVGQPAAGPAEPAEAATDATPATEADLRSPGPAEPEAAKPVGGLGERELTFSFRFQPWREVLDWFAEEAGLSLAMDVTPAGTFNYVDDRSYTPSEALDVLNSVLLTKGYTLVRRDKMLLIIDLEDELDATLVRDLLVEVPLKDLDKRGDFEVTKTRFTLRGVAPEEAEKQISKLLSPLGSIVVMPKAGQLVITETGGTLRTIREILDSLDEAVAEKSLKTYRLKRANVDQVIAAIKPLVGIPQDAGAAEDGSIRISTDAVSNTVFAAGNPDKIAIVEQVVEQMDMLGDLAAGGIGEAQQFIIHSVTTADPAAVLRVLQTMLAGQQEVRLEVVQGTGDVAALATPSQHRTIEATIAEMENNPDQIAVIPLHSLDPAAAALLINNMFANAQEGGGKGPTIDGTLDPQQLVVRGTQSQIDQVRQLLRSLGESLEDGLPVVAGRGNIRLLQIDSDTAQTVLQRIERVWSTMGRGNPIRVLTPPTVIERLPLERHGAGLSPRARRPDAPRRGAGRREPAGGGGSPAGPRFRRGTAPPAAQGDRSPPAETKSTQIPPKTARLSGVRFRLVAAAEDDSQSDSRAVDAAAEGLSSGASVAATGSGEPDQESAPESTLDSRPARADRAEIIVSVEAGGLVISSTDTEALDAFEALLDAFSRQSGSDAARFHLFYLKHVEAEVAKTLVENILAGVSSSTFGSSEAAKSAVSSLGGGLLGSSLGLGSGASRGGSMLLGSGVRMTADSRLNALFVQGSPADVQLVKQLLNVIDEESGPEEVLTFPKPKFIPVYYTSAEEVATVLRQLYADRIVADRSRSQSSSSGREAFMEAMRGRFGGRDGGDRGRGDRGGSSNRNAKADEGPKMSLGVDATSNSLIVSAPGPLLKEVEAVVEELDQRAATQNDQDVVVVTLKRANPQLVQESLKGFFGDDVRTSGGTSSSSSRGGSSTRGGPGGDDARRRFIEAMRARMMGGGGGPPGGGRGSSDGRDRGGRSSRGR